MSKSHNPFTVDYAIVGGTSRYWFHCFFFWGGGGGGGGAYTEGVKKKGGFRNVF